MRIVNLSVGDPARQFDGFLSPWARMVDWLAWKYGILFIISAGNHLKAIEIEMAMRAFDDLSAQGLEAAVLKAFAEDVRNRKLLAPAESMNALTFGALHVDGTQATANGWRKNPYIHTLPAPYSAVGFGYRQSLKPDLWLPGGRMFYGVHPANGNGKIKLDCVNFTSEPGHCVAGPSANAGEQMSVCYSRGTSNAAALGSHQAGLVCEQLIKLREEPNGEIIEDQYLGLLTKALMAHGATWGEAYEVLKQVLKQEKGEAEFNRQVCRFLGFGVPDHERVMRCDGHRATMLGCGSLKDDEAEMFMITLPPSLSGKKVRQRLIVTLAWFSPINSQHRNYRGACLWFTNPSGDLKLERQDVDTNTAQRGTLQHEVFEAEKATAFAEDGVLSVQVNCRADAGKMKESVPYALAVTLEVAEGSGIPAYDEVRHRLMTNIRMRQRVAPLR